MSKAETDIPEAKLKELASVAWSVRDNAYIIGKTRVGCAVLAKDGRIFAGCNVEHKFRSHDVHAEVNAITSMVAGGTLECIAVIVAAERDRFTPCGACMDWIMQFGGPTCVVGFQKSPGAEIERYTAHDLMPFYPN